MRYWVAAVIVLTGFALSLTPAPTLAAGAADMPADQRKAIETVIEEYLVRNPEVIERALRALEANRKAGEARAVQAALKTHGKELFNSPMTPVGGNPKGDVTVVEFFDYRCGFCKRVHPVVTKLMESDDRIRRVYKEWPILGPESVYASRAALASREQGKYLEFHKALMEAPGGLNKARVLQVATRIGLDTVKLLRDIEAPEVDQILRRNYAVAQDLRLNGTPSFLVGDQVIRGGRDLETMKRLVAQARAAAKNRPARSGKE